MGSTFPYKGGIAHYNAILFEEMLKAGHEGILISFSRQYPKILYPGGSDKDPSHFKVEAKKECYFLIDSINPLTWFSAVKKIADFRPSIVVIPWWHHYWTFCFSVIARLLRSRGIRVCFLCHNVFPHEGSRVARMLSRFTLKTGDCYIVHSEEEKAKLVGIIPDASFEVTIHPTYEKFNTATLSMDECRKTLGITANKVVLFFGFVRRYKGLMNAIKAMPKVLESENVTLLVVGEFWKDKKDYLDEIQRLGIAANVVIVDRYVTNEEMPLFFYASDFVLLPYLTATNSGILQLAYGFGKGVVASNIGGIGEGVEEGVSGFLVPPNDPEMLANGILRAYREGKAKTFSEGAELMVKTRFSWQRVIGAIERLGASTGCKLGEE